MVCSGSGLRFQGVVEVRVCRYMSLGSLARVLPIAAQPRGKKLSAGIRFMSTGLLIGQAVMSLVSGCGKVCNSQNSRGIM